MYHRIINIEMELNLQWGACSCFGDKPHVPLNVRSFVFYPLYITLFKISEEWWRHHITSRRTLIAYSVVRFEYASCSKDTQPGQTQNRASTIHRGHVLERIEFRLRKLKVETLFTWRFEMHYSWKERIHLQLMLSSYAASLPEAEERHVIGLTRDRNYFFMSP